MSRRMKTIAIVNAKGGCGKTTIATSMAAWLAYEHQVGLLDLDRQKSATDWLHMRLPDNPVIHSIPPTPWPPKTPKEMEYLIIDAPAGIANAQLNKLLASCTKIVVPILPSPIDMRASWRFLDNLFALREASKSKCEIGLIANRVKTWTIIYRELTGFVGQFRAPYVGHLRESINYIRAAEAGLGVAELPYYQSQRDWGEWQPLIDWVNL